MPVSDNTLTFDPSSSPYAYTVPDGVTEVDIEILGAGGGDGGDDGSETGGSGKPGGSVSGTLSVSPGESYTIYVGEGGGDGADNADLSTGGAGGTGWFEGGDGGSDSSAAGGGGGGGASAVIRDADSAEIAIADAGGGARSGADQLDSPGGGGGGARGGVAQYTGGTQGADAGGSGDGGDGGGEFSTATAGGATAGSPLASTSTSTGGGAAGDATVTVTETEQTVLSVTDTTTDAVDLEFNSDIAEDEYFVYRGTSAGFALDSAHQIATVAAGDPQTYTDSGLSESVKYFYVIEASNSSRTVASNEASTTTTLPAPTGLSATLQNGDDVALSWTDNAADEDGYRVYRSRDGGATYTQAADLAADTTSYTDAGLLDGEQYVHEVRAYTADAESASGQVTTTTVLPDVPEANAAAIAEDELTVSWKDITDYGDYRVQARESNEGQSWGAVADTTVGEATSSTTITGLEDGEGYDIRVRSQTEHVTGTYADTQAVTVLPAPSGLSVSNQQPTSQTVSWTDTADNEDAYRVERRKQYDGGGVGPYQTLASLAPGTTSYADSSLQPGTTYDYRISSVTEHTTSPATLETTTTSLGYGRDRVAASGWTVEVDVGGATRRPAVVGEPTFEPSLNQLPRVELPVAPDETWFDGAVEDAPLRVWRDGERLPIENVADVQEAPGRTVLVGLGGTDLLETQRRQFNATDVHDAAASVIDLTPYKRVVDDPSSDSAELADIDSDSEIETVIEDNTATKPYHISEDGVRPAQTNFWTEAEDEASSGVTDNVDFPPSDPQWSGGEAVDIQTSRGVSTTVETEHRIPASDLEITTRASFDDFAGQLRVFLNGTQISAYQFGGITIGSEVRDHSGGGLEPGITSDLPPGDHVVSVEVGPNTEGELYGEPYLDAISLHDSRFHDSTSWDFSLWDESVYFDDPRLFPTSLDITFLHEGFRSATGATVDVEGVTADNGFGLALSNDGGQSYDATTTNSTSLSATFSSPGPDVTLRTTHTAHGSRPVNTPLTGFETHTVDGWVIDIDTRNSPPVENTTYDDDARDILTDLVERGTAVWAVTWDDATRQVAVEVTNTGQRTADRTLDLVDYEWSKATLDRQVEDATIRGGAQRVRGEEITATRYGSGEPLDNSFVVPGREQVESKSSGTIYTRGVDYEIEYQDGFVTPLSGGAISEGEALLVGYEYKPFARTSVTASDPRKAITETFTAAQSSDLCRAIAGFLVDRLGDPVETGTAVIDDLPPGVSVLDALAADPLPTTDTYHVADVSVDDGSVTIQWRNRRSVSQTVADIRSRLGGTEDRV